MNKMYQTKQTVQTNKVMKAFFVRYLMILALLLGVAGTVWGQQYVFLYKNGNTVSFLRNNNGSIQAQTNFGTYSSTCIWTGTGTASSTFKNGNYYIQRNNGNVRLNASSTTWTISNGMASNYRNYYGDYYIRYNSGWTLTQNGSPSGVDYTVLFTYSNPTLVTITSITGDEVLTTTGGHNYSATGKATQFHQFDGYSGTTPTAYYWYSDALQTELPTPTSSDGVSYSWSLNANGANASVNSSNGTITVNALPASDVAMTLTCTASKNGESATTTKTVYLLAENPSAPVISLYGSSQAQITCPSPNVTIYYTTDGSTTPTNASTEYSGPFAIDCPTTTVKAISVRNGHNSTTASTTLTCKVPAPVITLVGANASIALGAGSPDGTALYFTTDGTTPTDASTPYNGSPVTLTNTQTIKVIAIKSGYTNSDIASAEYVETGVSGTKVIIDDREDHNWSYYQASGNLPTGYPTEYLSSPNPRNVKITYRGGGVTNASAVAISALDGEGQNEMIYYKTLEKSVPGMSGDYPYTVISNPFSKRPKLNTTYYGFAGWKVISGGEYISEYANNAVLPLDATIHFVNLPSGNTGNGAVVFEATWTAATVKTGNSAQSFTGGTYETNFWVLSGNSNIGNLDIPGNCTMSARYPDGTTNFTRNLTGRIRANGDNSKVEFVNMNSTGQVNARGYTFTVGRGVTNSGDGGDLIGCAADQACVHTVKVESGKYASLRNFTSGISSGNSVDQFMILGCDYDRARAVSTASYNEKLNITGSMYVAGTSLDLQRASGALYVRCIIKSGNFLSSVAIDNNYTGAGGTQTYYFSVGNSNTQNAGRRYLVMEGGIIKGIAGGMDEDNDQNTGARAFDLRVRGTAQIDGVVYGAAEYAGARGIRTMVFTGGTINGWIAGGANGTQESGGALNGTSYLYFGGTARAVCANATANTVMNRAVGGNVFGAGCGYNNNSTAGQVSLGTNVVIADESIIDRGVYGGGSYGYTTSTSKIFILGGTVNGKDGGVNGTSYQPSITGGVFGGACQNQGGTVNITMTGGLVKGGIFGGSNSTGTLSGSVTMHIDGGQVGVNDNTRANIHGGGYGQNTTVSGNVTLNLGTCNATSGVTVYGDVYGGSALGTVNTDANNTTTVSLYKGTIYGGLYGGALGQTTPSSIAAAVNGKVAVKVFGGSVLCTTSDPDGEAGTGSVFGCNNVNGTPASTVTVDIYKTDQPLSGYALHAVYGGGNKSAYSGTPVVTIHGCNNSIEYVYGGGNATDVQGTDVTIWGGNIGNAFAGGNGYSETNNHTNSGQPHYNPGANITSGGTHLTIHGGTIGAAFGGSNQYGTITGGVYVDVTPATETASRPACVDEYERCAMDIEELYLGGNQAPLISSRSPMTYIGKDDLHLTLACDANVGMLFGGAKAADYVGDIVLNVDGGTFNKVFGGNNKGGTITGNVTVNFKGGTAREVYGGCNESGDIKGIVTVNIDENSSRCGVFYVENVYGGGNLAGYNPETARVGADRLIPLVNIKNGTVQENVYGGGYGNTAVVTGNPVVTVGDATPGYNVLVLGNVFGGGNAAQVTGSTDVSVIHSAIVGSMAGGEGNIFGGGNAAVVTGDTKVYLGNRAKIYGNVYGGGNQGEVNGDTKVIVNSD